MSLTAHLSPTARRTTALLILVLLLTGIGLLAYAPVWYIGRQDQELLRLDGRVANLQDGLAVREQLLAEQRLLERAMRLDTALLEAPTPSLAAAELQTLLVTLVKLDGGEVQSVQTIEPKPLPPFTEIGLKLNIHVALDSLRHLLYAIESSSPILLVQSIVLQSGNVRPESTEPVVVDAAIEVMAYTRPPRAE